MAKNYKEMNAEDLQKNLTVQALAQMSLAELNSLREAVKKTNNQDLLDNLSIAINNATFEAISNSADYSQEEKKMALDYRNEYNQEIKLAAIKRKAERKGNKYIFANLTKGEMDLLMSSGIALNDIVVREPQNSGDTRKKLEEQRDAYRTEVADKSSKTPEPGSTLVLTPDMFAALQEEQNKNDKQAPVVGVTNSASDANDTAVAPVVFNETTSKPEENNNKQVPVAGVVNKPTPTAKPKKESWWKRAWNKIKKPLVIAGIFLVSLLGAKRCGQQQAQDANKEKIEQLTLANDSLRDANEAANATIDDLTKSLRDCEDDKRPVVSCRCNEPKKTPVRPKKIVRTPTPKKVVKDPVPAVNLPDKQIPVKPFEAPKHEVEGNINQTDVPVKPGITYSKRKPVDFYGKTGHKEEQNPETCNRDSKKTQLASLNGKKVVAVKFGRDC